MAGQKSVSVFKMRKDVHNCKRENHLRERVVSRSQRPGRAVGQVETTRSRRWFSLSSIIATLRDGQPRIPTYLTGLLNYPAAPHPNLVSESLLIDQTINLLRSFGGRRRRSAWSTS